MRSPVHRQLIPLPPCEFTSITRLPIRSRPTILTRTCQLQEELTSWCFRRGTAKATSSKQRGRSRFSSLTSFDAQRCHGIDLSGPGDGVDQNGNPGQHHAHAYATRQGVKLSRRTRHLPCQILEPCKRGKQVPMKIKVFQGGTQVCSCPKS